MTRYLAFAEPFTCAICGKACGDDRGQVWPRWTGPSRRDLPPICWNCEQDWGTGPWATDVMLDHRLKRQVSALANALAAEAASREAGYGGLYV